MFEMGRAAVTCLTSGTPGPIKQFSADLRLRCLHNLGTYASLMMPLAFRVTVKLVCSLALKWLWLCSYRL